MPINKFEIVLQEWVLHERDSCTSKRSRLLKEEYDDTIAAKIHHHKSHDSRNYQD